MSLPAPAHWRAGKIKNVAQVTLGKMLQSANSDTDIAAPYLRAANVQPDGVLRIEDRKMMWFGEDELCTLDLRAGDVVVVEGGVGGFGRAAYIERDLDGWGFQNSINRLRPLDGVDGRFLAYYLLAQRARGFIAAYCNIVSMPHLTAEKLAAMPMPIPPGGEQRTVANYLDRETVRIDELVGKKQQLIATLRERRGSVAERALLGLQWSVPLRSATMLIQTGPFGSQLKAGEYMLGGVPVINPSHLVNGRITADALVAVTAEKADDLGRHALQNGDVIVARRGELGRCAVVDEHSVGYLCGTGSALIRPRPGRVSSDFLAAVFRSRVTREALELASVGSTMDNLNAGILGGLVIPVPSIREQRQIVTDIVDQTDKIDTLITKAERFIELARERRGALITAAVTGQIDVREAA